MQYSLWLIKSKTFQEWKTLLEAETIEEIEGWVQNNKIIIHIILQQSPWYETKGFVCFSKTQVINTLNQDLTVKLKY